MQQKIDLDSVLKLEEEKLENGLARELIIFKSSFDEEVPCYLFHHRDQEQRPAIVVASGRGEGIIETAGIKSGYQNSNALKLAQAGFVVITCENRGQGKLQYYCKTSEYKDLKNKKITSVKELVRKEDVYNNKLFSKIETKEIPVFFGIKSYLGLLLEDQRKALDYLESLPYVDADKIGAAGISLGGETAFYLGAIDQRIKSVVVMGWLTSWSELLDDVQDWRIPQIESHFSSMADIGVLLIPRYSLFHNGIAEGRMVIGVGFPSDLASLIFEDISSYYHRVLVPTRTEFYSLDVEHEFVNHLAIDFLQRSLKRDQGKEAIKSLGRIASHKNPPKRQVVASG